MPVFDGHRRARLSSRAPPGHHSESKIEHRTSPEGRFANGATVIGVEDVDSTGRGDVKGVNPSSQSA